MNVRIAYEPKYEPPSVPFNELQEDQIGVVVSSPRDCFLAEGEPVRRIQVSSDRFILLAVCSGNRHFEATAGRDNDSHGVRVRVLPPGTKLELTL